MSVSGFDDPELRTAMREYVRSASALDEASQVGDEPRRLLDLAEAQAIAAMSLRKKLEAQGWTAPVGQRTTT